MSNDIHLRNAEIMLVGNKVMYQMGDYIHGKLIISLNGRLSLSRVKLRLTCVATIKPVDNSMYQKEGKVCMDKNLYKHVFLDHTYELPEQICATTLQPGNHEIPFKFQLPESGIPSSFESIYGCICYFIEYIIGESDRSHRSGCEIIVEAPVKDNLYLSVGGSTEKDLGILCLGSGKISLSTHINKKGFLAGESLDIHCFIDNLSTVSVTPRATLYQTQIFMTGDKHKTIEIQLSEPILGSVINAGHKQQEILKIKIPEKTILTMKSSLITVKYFIHLTLDIPYTIDLHLNLPIVITNKYALT
ncbi:arrestin domain-containing protein 4-like [Oppia nitens]|uniref:arrestin domain-containing protein 4-like n=1 Tax=Oppia nitens TaxID=1686743 RepID=UPI0023DB774A|nr:arrestin domain-containing protein 4-like [Oppia nitens]